MDRRDFLKKTGGATLFSCCGGVGGSLVFGNAYGLPITGNGNLLIHTELIGGADFRHLFVPPPTTPFGNSFWNARNSLYNVDNKANWSPTDSWTTDYVPTNWGGVRFGIHKNAGWISKQLTLGNLAIICNVKHSENRRHDHSQLIMNSGKPDISNYNYDTSGWGGRIVQSLPTAKIVSMTDRIGLVCKSDVADNRNSHLISAPNIRELALAELPVDEASTTAGLSRSLKAYYAKRGLELTGPALKVVRNERSIRAIGRRIQAILDTAPLPIELTSLSTSTVLSEKNREKLSQQLMNIYDGLQVSTEIDLRIASLQIDDWDTHKDQKDRLEVNFSDLFGTGKALDILSQVIERDFGTQVSDNIVYAFTTDFGREIKSNGTAGTDHGEGNYMILIGPQVRSGIYGSMFPDEEIPKYLEISPAIVGLTSFERVLAKVSDWMGVTDPYAVFPDRDASPLEAGVSLDSLFSKNVSRLAGTIETIDGFYLADATITVSNGTDINLLATSSIDGTYVVDNIPEGSYSLAVSKEGYEIPTSYQYIVSSTSLVKNFIASPAAGTVSGRVTTPDGIGLSNVKLWDTNRYPETITTDTTGFYITTGYTAGDEVYINYFSTDYSVVTSGWTSGFFTHTGGAMQGYNFIAIPKNDTRWVGTVTGKVVDGNGAGIAGVKVWDENTSPAIPALTDAGGYYEIPNFVAGQSVSITALREGYNIQSDNVALQFTHNGNAIVGRNFIASLVQGTISGRIITLDGSGLPGVTVWDVAKYPTMVSTDVNGYYILSDYNIGDSVTLNVFKAGYTTVVPWGWSGATFVHDGSAITSVDYTLSL